MPTGSCFCGNIKVEYSGEPVMTVCACQAALRVSLYWPLYCLLTLAQALCHCSDCRKISGGNYSNNIVVPSENFKILSGNPKQISKTADSGKEITSKPRASV
jgi:hypothetical protein